MYLSLSIYISISLWLSLSLSLYTYMPPKEIRRPRWPEAVGLGSAGDPGNVDPPAAFMYIYIYIYTSVIYIYIYIIYVIYKLSLL